MLTKIKNKIHLIVPVLVFGIVFGIILGISGNNNKNNIDFSNYINAINSTDLKDFEKIEDESNLFYTKEGSFLDYTGTIKLNRYKNSDYYYSNKFITVIADDSVDSVNLNELVSKFIDDCSNYINYDKKNLFFNYRIGNDKKLDKSKNLKDKLLDGVTAFYSFVANDKIYSIDIYYEDSKIMASFSNDGEYVNKAVKLEELTEEQKSKSYEEIDISNS